MNLPSHSASFWTRFDVRYRALTVLSVASTVLAYFADWFPSNRGAFLKALHWAAAALAANLAAGFIGAMATAFFIESRLEQARGEERRRIDAVAVRDFREPIESAITHFCSFIIRSTPRGAWATLGGPPRSFEELCEERYASALEWLNPAVPSFGTTPMTSTPAAGLSFSWEVLFHLGGVGQMLPRFEAALSRYGTLLDSEFLGHVQAFQQDEYVAELRRLDAKVKALQPGEVLTLCRTAPARRTCLTRLLALARAYERRIGERIGLPEYVTAGNIKADAWGGARFTDLPSICTEPHTAAS